MYQYTDNNAELYLGIEPEYTASYCHDKREVTCFVDGMASDSFRHINTLSEAQKVADLWRDNTNQ